jgi:hypothetical protein
LAFSSATAARVFMTDSPDHFARSFARVEAADGRY